MSTASSLTKKAVTRRPRLFTPQSFFVEQCVDLTGLVVAQKLIHEVLQGIGRTCEIELSDPTCPHVLRATEVDLILPHVEDHLGRKITHFWVRREVDVQ